MLIKHLTFVFIFFAFVRLQAQEKQSKFKESFKPSLVITTDFSYEFKSENFQKSEIFIKPEFTYKINKKTK